MAVQSNVGLLVVPWMTMRRCSNVNIKDGLQRFERSHNAFQWMVTTVVAKVN